MPLIPTCLLLITVGVFAILGVLIWIGLLLSRLAKLRMLGGMSSPRHNKHSPDPNGGGPMGGFAVWEWRDGRWGLVSDNLPVGVAVGPPPGYPGAFDGEVVKTWVRA